MISCRHAVVDDDAKHGDPVDLLDVEARVATGSSFAEHCEFGIQSPGISLRSGAGYYCQPTPAYVAVLRYTCHCCQTELSSKCRHLSHVHCCNLHSGDWFNDTQTEAPWTEGPWPTTDDWNHLADLAVDASCVVVVKTLQYNWKQSLGR